MKPTNSQGFAVITDGGLESKDAASTGETKGADDGVENKVVAFKDVKGLLDAGRKDIKSLLDQHAEAAEESKAALQTKLDEAVSHVEGLQVKFAELRSQVDEVELKGLRGGVQGYTAPKNVAERFVASPEYKSFVDGNLKGSLPFKIEGGFEGRKADAIITEGSATSGAALTEPFLIQQPFRAPIRQLVMRDVLPRNTINTNSLEYIQQNNFNYLYGEIRTTTGIGAVTVQFKTPDTDGSEFAGVQGFYDGQSVTFSPGLPAEETLTVSNIDYVAGTFDVTTTAAHPADGAVTAEDYQFTAETVLKPRARATYTRVTNTVQTLATSIPVSRQVMRDATLLSQMINTQLIESLRLTEETQILYGDGTNDQLLGFFNNAAIPTFAWSAGVVGDTKIDAIRRAMTLAQLAHFPVEAILIHPSDWQDIELLKDDNNGANTGNYLLPNVPVSTAQPQLFRVPVITTTALVPGDCLLGAFSVGASLWDREEANIRTADQHEDFFARNMELILAEERMMLVVVFPESFVRVDFDVAP